jgi:hypothetical protein
VPVKCNRRRYNAAVHAVVARALGIDLRAAALKDGNPPPSVGRCTLESS